MQHNPPQNITITDLLLSLPTYNLVSKWRLTGALNHARFIGNQRGQRVRHKGFLYYESATFIQVELHDKDRNVFTSLILVDDSWKALAEEDQKHGGYAPGSADAQLALGELEARIRHCPAIAEMEIGNRASNPISLPSIGTPIPPAQPALKPVVAPARETIHAPVAPVVAAPVVIETEHAPSATDDGGVGELVPKTESPGNNGSYEKFDPLGADVESSAVKPPTQEELAVYGGQAGASDR